VIEPYRLRIDARVEPHETTGRPVFSWAVRSDGRESGSPAGRLEVRLEPALGHPVPVWSTAVPGGVISVDYTGERLAPFSRYGVELVLDGGGRVASFFETGPLAAGDWQAAWIARDTEPAGRIDAVDAADAPERDRPWLLKEAQPVLQLRRTLEAREGLVRARLHATAKGVYRAAINGVRVGDDELAPGWTDYRSRITYQSHDVTALIRPGQNVLSALVGDGWWSGFLGFDARHQAQQYGAAPEFLCLLILEYADGRVERVTTDGSWREHAGALVFSDLLMGERHDDLTATPGWQLPGFDDTAWRPVVVTGEDAALLTPQTTEPVRAVATREPLSIDHTAARTIVDFGQNLVGRVRLPLPHDGRARVVRLRHAEMLDGGELYTENLRSAIATDELLLAADSDLAVYEPLFTVHGFRYVEITGLESVEGVTAVVLSSDLAQTATLETSSPLVNQLLSNIEWGRRGNFVSVPTDCPQRDERLGWTADAQVFADTAARSADVQSFFGSWLDDLARGQLPDGSVPDIIPRPPALRQFDHGAPAWGDAAVLVPWSVYRAYGDVGVLRRQFDSMTAWVDRVAARNPDGLWTSARGNDYGDWLSVGEQTPHEVVATAFHARSAQLLARTARILGQTAVAERAADRARVVARAFADAYIAADGTVEGDTQTGYLLALAFGLAPCASADRLVAALERRDGLLSTGFVGVGLLCPTLVDVGRADLAYDLLLEERFPSWGFSIAQGATTLWERWDGWTPEQGFQAASMNSFNHYSLGSVGDWIHRDVGGIRQHEDSAGYSRVRIGPVVDPRVTSADLRFESVCGAFRSHWQVADGMMQIEATVPPGVEATLEVAGFSAPLPHGTSEHTIPLT
jgi:alpha-L-rhamnosidase